MGEQRRQFTREFKLEAVRLVTEDGRRLSEVARDLGIRADMLRRWQVQLESRSGLGERDVFPGHGKMTSQEEELRRLRRELELTKQENEFLKKAAAYFARESR